MKITTEAELRELLGEPQHRSAIKVRPALHQRVREWLAASPFALIGTADARGRCDVSPKGDPAGFTHVIDDVTIAIPERPGNKRGDGLFNILANPHVGLLFLVPGRTDTLRINGRAHIVRDAPYFDQLIAKGHRPELAVVVEIDEVFYHCPKAFMRSGLWRHETWDQHGLISHAQIIKSVLDIPDTLDDLETYYGPTYADRLYKKVH
jgi:PPOX class probable FMN-dependent enzyme